MRPQPLRLPPRPRRVAARTPPIRGSRFSPSRRSTGPTRSLKLDLTPYHATVAAAGDEAAQQRYKAPVFVNANIHGNEWEGTDAVLRVATDLATSTDPAVGALLDRTRLYFVMTMNPDGRVAGTRASGNGFDMNRDFITASQPEVRAVRQALIDTQPLVMLDLHGYVNGTLIEPTTPPHGQNYEYDLFIRQAYPNGLAMEAAVNGLGYTPEENGVLPVQIPSGTTRRAGTTGPPSSRRSTPPSTARFPTRWRSRCASTTPTTNGSRSRSCAAARRSTSTWPRRPSAPPCSSPTRPGGPGRGADRDLPARRGR